jgi:hypothetical protein
MELSLDPLLDAGKDVAVDVIDEVQSSEKSQRGSSAGHRT